MDYRLLDWTYSTPSFAARDSKKNMREGERTNIWALWFRAVKPYELGYNMFLHTMILKHSKRKLDQANMCFWGGPQDFCPFTSVPLKPIFTKYGWRCDRVKVWRFNYELVSEKTRCHKYCFLIFSSKLWHFYKLGYFSNLRDSTN